MKHSILFAVAFGVVTATSSPGVGSPATDFDAIFRASVQDHPRLQALFQQWQGALRSVAEARGWPDPQLSWTWYLQSVETALGPQEHALALSQRIPWFGKLGARGDAVEESARAAGQRLRTEQLRLYERAAEAWFEIAYLDRALEVTGESLDLLGQAEAVLRSRYRVNESRYSDLLRLESELSRLRDRRRSLDDRRRTVAVRLNDALGRELEAPLPTTVSLSSPLRAPADSLLRETLLAGHPSLRALEHEIHSSEHRVDLARKEGYPDLRVRVQTILTGESELTGFDDAGRDAWMATVSVDLPIFRGKIAGGVDAAVARTRALEHRRGDRLRQLRVEVEDAIFARADARATEKLYLEEVVPRARRAMETTLKDYTSDRVGFLDFIDTQRQLLDLQLELARARADRLQAEAHLLSLADAAPHLSSQEVPR